MEVLDAGQLLEQRHLRGQQDARNQCTRWQFTAIVTSIVIRVPRRA